ncbi:CUB domain-containing protein [Phthorimaea operculella]|nr:CUB domain-containing protein [Phthorimaea operculella]
MRRTLAVLLVANAYVTAQIAWTPIFLDGSSQVDLWTQSSTGCACPGGVGGEDCACCARDGACPCGDIAPTRCAQCGLEQYCANMCNITIDSRVLKSKSGKTFGQIKSPSIEGPDSCSYFLQPDAGQRVEIQIYRLVSVGRFNGSSCVGGWLQLSSASAVKGALNAAEMRLCGANERYTPPVVLFADHGASMLEFRITEKTVRSQFLAFFSFTSLSNTQGVGFHPRGGSRIPQTDCDWLYQDVSCRGPGSCVLASPGYPGLYPPHRRCRYLFATNSVHTRVKIIFTSILLPRNHCATDYLTLRAGSSPSAPLLASLCSERSTTLEHPGPNLLLEFNSGALVPPYDYNGFIAKLEFVERLDSSGPPPTVIAASPPLAALTHILQHGE